MCLHLVFKLSGIAGHKAIWEKPHELTVFESPWCNPCVSVVPIVPVVPVAGGLRGAPHLLVLPAALAGGFGSDEAGALGAPPEFMTVWGFWKPKGSTRFWG